MRFKPLPLLALAAWPTFSHATPQAAPEAGARVQPYSAMANPLEGQATINCRLDPPDRVADCKLVDETPPDRGFGLRALQAAARLRFKPTGVGEVPTRVTIPLRFTTSAPTAQDAPSSGELRRSR